MDIEEVVCKILADASQYSRTMDQAIGTANSFANELASSFNNSMKMMSKGLGNIANNLTAGLKKMQDEAKLFGGTLIPPEHVHQVKQLIEALKQLEDQAKRTHEAQKALRAAEKARIAAIPGLKENAYMVSGYGGSLPTAGGSQAYLSGYNPPKPSSNALVNTYGTSLATVGGSLGGAFEFIRPGITWAPFAASPANQSGVGGLSAMMTAKWKAFNPSSGLGSAALGAQWNNWQIGQNIAGGAAWMNQTMKGTSNIGPLAVFGQSFANWWKSPNGPGGGQWWTNLSKWWGSNQGPSALASNFSRAFGTAARTSHYVASGASGLHNAMQSGGNTIGGIAFGVAAGLGLYKLIELTQQAGRSALQMAADYEVASASFEVMTGSAEKAQKLLGDLNRMAVETPFTATELIASAKQLTAFGIEVHNIIPTLQVLGNVSAGTGTSMERIILAYGQVQVAGRLMGQELRQFTDAGIPIIEELARVMGQPVGRIKAMVQEGAVSSYHVTRAFERMSAAGGRYAGLMDRVAGTVQGRWTALQETFGIFAREAGLAFFEGSGMADVLDSMVKGLSGSKDFSWAKNFGKDVREMFEVVRGAITGMSSLITTHFDTIKSAIGSVIITWILYKSVLVSMKIAMIALQAVALGMSLLMAPIQLGVGLLSLLGTLLAFGPAGIAAAVAIGAFATALSVLYGVTLANFDFKGFGEQAFESFLGFLDRTKDTAMMAWEGIAAAFKTSDLQVAFEIASLGIKAIFFDLMAALGKTWNDFIKKVFMATPTLLGKAIAFPIMEATLIDNKFASDQSKMYSDQMRDLSKQAIEKERLASSPTRFMQKILDKTYEDMIGLEFPSNVKRTPRELDNFRFDKQLAFQALANSAGRMETEGSFGRIAELVRVQAYVNRMFPELAKQGGGSGVGIDKKIPISAEAQAYATDIVRSMKDGTDPYTKFQKSMSRLYEAQGTDRGIGALGGMGVGLLKGTESLLTDKQFQFGLLNNFRELQGQSSKRDNFSPTMLLGSAEAEATIARSSVQATSIQEEVLRVLTETKALHEAKKKADEELAKVLEKLAQNKPEIILKKGEER